MTTVVQETTQPLETDASTAAQPPRSASLRLEPLRVEDVHPKDANRVRLLHLSDLHFTASQSKYLDDALKFLEYWISRHQEEDGGYDLLVVTGDLIDHEHGGPRLATLQRVRTYLERLCEVLRIEPSQALRVIPGNHDYRWRGNIRKAAAIKDFSSVFSDYFCHTIFPKLNLLVASFDSNHGRTRFELATGLVDMSAFAKLDAQLSKLDPATLNSLFRVALVHHHPLPIPGAETRLPTWFEEKFRKGRVVGTPESMMLRNSGSFLNQLLRNQFRLVLHGHLHHPGYWRPLCYVDGEDRWLEIVACGTSCKPEGDGRFMFNSITLYPDGHLQVVPQAFDNAGNGVITDYFEAAPYEVVRSHGWSRRPVQTDDDENLECESLSKTWITAFPDGDLDTSETWTGLRAVRGSADTLTLFNSATGLTESDFDVQVIGPSAVKVQPQPRTCLFEPAVPIERIPVRFEPALDEDSRLTLFVQRLSKGILFCDQEDREWFHDSEEESKTDHCSVKVRVPCERLSLRMRFLAGSWIPRDVRLRVRDAKGLLANRERECSQIFLNALPVVDRNNVLVCLEAVLEVYRPQRGYQYGFEWTLPEPQTSIKSDIRIRTQRERLANQMARPLRDFVGGLDSWIGRYLEEHHPDIDKDPLTLTFFLFDPVTARLRAIAQVGQDDAGIARVEFPWGKGVVGTAFRREVAYQWRRRRFRSHAALLRPLPEAVEVLQVIPLPAMGCSPARFIGLLAIASASPDSSLRLFGEEPDEGNLQDRVLMSWAHTMGGVTAHP